MKLYTAIAHGVAFTLLSIVASAQKNALDFDGIDDYIKVPHSASNDVTNAVTIEAWVYPTSSNWDNILMKGNYGFGFALSGFGGTGSCGSSSNLVYWDQSQCGSTIRSSLTYSANTWQHVAVTAEDIGTQVRIYFYINGVQDGPFFSGATAIDNGGIDNAVYIGAQGLGLGNFFQGTMDELRLWNVVRTQAQIQAAMNTELDPAAQAGLVAYYPFNQGTPGGDNTGVTTAKDSTANGNNGTLHNFTLNGPTSNWVGQSPVILPIQLLSFRAIEKGSAVELDWSTAQEQNSSSFEIQRSSNGKQFASIGSVSAAGNSSDRIDYHFTDSKPVDGNNYYRLRETDADDRFVYSSVVTQSIHSDTYIKLHGNPVHNQLKAVFYGKASGTLQVIISDGAGAALINRSIAVQAGANEIVIPMATLKSGLYYLQAGSGTWKQVVKFSRL